MHSLNLDREKCQRRNRLIGLRGTAESSRIRFVGSGQSGGTVIAAVGSLPTSDSQALAIINSKIPGPKLRADDVHLHQMEAASTRYVPDRFMFIHPSTLKNIARDAAEGFAFMNSHRTGDLSTPSELPFGRTFAGQYQTARDPTGNTIKRAVVGVYMLRGQSPNGQSGPTTDAISAGIDGGTIFDVSMGLYGGQRICNVCQQNFKAKDDQGNYLCPHVPGTHRHMTKEQKDAQKARGIADGVASYSLVDASPGEVSAVYDGAVPGAGFAKARRLAANNQFTRSEWTEVLAAYPTLLQSKGRPQMSGRQLLQRLGILLSDDYRDDGFDDDGFDDEPSRSTSHRQVQLPPVLSREQEIAQLKAQVDALKADMERERSGRPAAPSTVGYYDYPSMGYAAVEPTEADLQRDREKVKTFLGRQPYSASPAVVPDAETSAIKSMVSEFCRHRA